MLHVGDAFPHIHVRTVDGQTFSYAAIWQHKQLVLVVVSTSQADASYVSALSARASEFSALETECVMTRENVTGLRTPAVVVADRWGEVVHIAEPSASARRQLRRATARCLAEARRAKADHRAKPVAEIVQCGEPTGSAGLPSPDELIKWVDYVRQRCPECEGEAR